MPMKNIFLFFVLTLVFGSAFGQQYNKSKTCGKDTIWVTERKFDNVNRYKAVECEQVSKLGIRLEFAVAGFNYNKPTRAWLGSRKGISLGLIVPYENFSVGIRCKFMSISSQSALSLDSFVVPQGSRVNPVKIDYFVSYSFNFPFNLSAEPYIGYSQNSVRLLDRSKDNGNRSAITGGIITGLALNKYFRIKDYQFVALFLSGGYSFADFSKINPALGRGYAEWSVGVAYKGFTKRSIKSKIHG
jgi:hypothetical protein